MKEPKACRKFQDGTADIGTWVAHINETKCPKCIALARYFQQDTELRRLARLSRN